MLLRRIGIWSAWVIVALGSLLIPSPVTIWIGHNRAGHIPLIMGYVLISESQCLLEAFLMVGLQIAITAGTLMLAIRWSRRSSRT
jgi:hypothetical protein